MFQKRQDGSEDFYRTWTEYKNGFGKLRSEFWLGIVLTLFYIQINYEDLFFTFFNWFVLKVWTIFKKINVHNVYKNYCTRYLQQRFT